MPSFDFAITKRTVLPCLKKHHAKSRVKKYLFEGPMQPPLPQEQRSGLVYAPIAHQIRLILESGPRVKVYAPYLATMPMQVERVSGYYMRLNAAGFAVSNAANFRVRHAKALIDLWQQDGCTSRDMNMLWTGLVFWARTLGKGVMLDPLVELVPKWHETRETKGFDAVHAPGRSFKVSGSNHV